MDSINCTQEQANKAGADLMQYLFGIDVRNFPQWRHDAAPPSQAENRGESDTSTVKPVYQEESQGSPGMWSDVTPGYYEARLQGHFKGGALRCLYAAPPSQAEDRGEDVVYQVKVGENQWIDVTKDRYEMMDNGSADHFRIVQIRSEK